MQEERSAEHSEKGACHDSRAACCMLPVTSLSRVSAKSCRNSREMTDICRKLSSNLDASEANVSAMDRVVADDF